MLLASAWPADEVRAGLLSATAAAAAGRSAADLVPDRVLSLTQGVLNAMFLSKWKAVTVIVTVTTLAGLGLGGLAHSTPAGSPAPAAARDDQPPRPADAPPRVVRDQ